MRYLSVCSGIEAATVAWHPLRWGPVAFAEIEKFPSQVLAHHYPHVPNLGDMSKYEEWSLGTIDLIVGGTPCQSFSVAGLRKGLSDDRGNLSLVYCSMVHHFSPTWTLWENVPGALSSKDNAFGCFLAGLVGEDEPFVPSKGKWATAGVVSGPKRTAAWRILDAQYFGVAQRRRRLFVLSVRGSGNWTAARALFPQSKGLPWNPAESRKARQEAPRSTRTGFASGSEQGTVIPHLAARMVAFGEYAVDGTASTCKARDYKDATDLVAYGIPGNWIGRAPENGGNAVEPMLNISPCQTSTDRHGVCYPINTMTCQGRPSDDLNPRMGLGIGEPNDPCPTLTKAHSHAVAVFDQVQITSATNRSRVEYGQPAPTMSKNSNLHAITHSHAVAFGGQMSNPQVDFEINATLQAKNPAAVMIQMQVRRLTPIECERLQGFPDGYTDIQPNGKPTPDGPRYKALGNSMAVPVMRWIGEQINRE